VIIEEIFDSRGGSSVRSFWIGYQGPGVAVRLTEVNQCGNVETTLTTYNGNSESYICISHMFFGAFTWNFAQNSYYLEVTPTRANTSTCSSRKAQFA